MKIQSLIASIAVTAVLTLLPPSSRSIEMIEKLAVSITLVEYAKTLLDKQNQS
jgi:hypothetical protein